MKKGAKNERTQNVATREGGVDRNINLLIRYGGMTKSPPARVAWIETIQ